MKTLTLTLVISLFLVSCQEEANPNAAQENIWKKRTTADTNITRADADDATNAPIDGGLSVLLIAGGLYGAKRLYKNKKA
ncbi:MAG: hypothetical protein EOP53_24785 [Sphingobacteriales bacterium]|nr:MAG: hypothetical protein EOP53_24785 [Sphingobacteriales bacterium]